MTTPLKNQPAFPLVMDSEGKLTADSPGLTKLELFSAMAMQGFIASPCEIDASEYESCGLPAGMFGSLEKLIALKSVRAAKALLAELEKKKA